MPTILVVSLIVTAVFFVAMMINLFLMIDKGFGLTSINKNWKIHTIVAGMTTLSGTFSVFLMIAWIAGKIP